MEKGTKQNKTKTFFLERKPVHDIISGDQLSTIE